MPEPSKDSNLPAPLKVNISKGMSGVGVVILILVLFAVAVAFSTPKEGAHSIGWGMVAIIPLPCLLILYRSQVEIDPETHSIKTDAGLWPWVRRRETYFDQYSEITVDAYRTKYGCSYGAYITIPMRSKPLRILADGDGEQIKEVIRFAGQVGLALKSKKGFDKYAPEPVRYLLSEHPPK